MKKNVELYGRVRYAVRIEGLSERAAARRFGLDPRTVSKMMEFSGAAGLADQVFPHFKTTAASGTRCSRRSGR